MTVIPFPPRLRSVHRRAAGHRDGRFSRFDLFRALKPRGRACGAS